MRQLIGIVWLLSVGMVWGEVLKDGNFDALEPGSPPNCDWPAGAWLFTDEVIEQDCCEINYANLAIVDTGDFDDGATGNSLALRAKDTPDGTTFHLLNVFDPIRQTEHNTLLLRFDVWIPDGEIVGGSVYLAADTIFLRKRGPQIAWRPGSIVDAVAHNSDGTARFVRLLDNAPTNQWQSWFLRIDQKHRRYNVYWAPRGEPLQLARSAVDYRGYIQLSYLDRLGYAYFGDATGAGRGYLDNVQLFFDRTGDLNCDDAVNFADIDPFVSALIDPDDYATQFPFCNVNNADTNQDQSIDFDDIDGFVNCLVEGC